MRGRWTRLLALAGSVVAGIVVVVVGLAVVARHDDHAPAPPVAPRFSDLSGLVVATTAETKALVASEVDGRRVVGPAEVRIRGRRVSIPRGTSLYGNGCTFVAESGFFRPQGFIPCYAQVGLRADRTTARWVAVFDTSARMGPKREPVYSVGWTGQVVEVRGDNIIFSDGVVVPGADARVGCGPGKNVPASEVTRHPECGGDFGWAVTIDEQTGRARELGAIAKM